MTFEGLIGSIEQTHQQLGRQAKLAVNVSLTIRNWLIGGYLVEYEQAGADRARYGAKLVQRVADRLTAFPRTSARELRRYRQLYLTYPQIWETLSPELTKALASPLGALAIAEKRESASPVSRVPGARLLQALSFSHLDTLLKIEDADKRRFYELHCIQATWSVRELKRQIASLYYERTALSTDKEALHAQTRATAEVESPALEIRDPYVFEFLGLKPAEVMGESELEDALLSKLQGFLLELGHGFCFEARQKRLLIGETHNFVDLVFYHRVLKCHVLVELKVGKFTHEHIGQLNSYVSWYAEHEMTEGDSPPIGLLLCTEKDHTVVKYALAGMSNQLFVSRYKVALPSEAEIEGMLAGVLG
ncbi:MAG: cytoplasmic protein [Deltaproteobacteria bacterium]|nr:MAG: cytoplasmic protein [Deltaproteobacteria bacterium]